MVDQWEKVKVKKQRNWNYVGELSPYFLQFMINTGRMKTENKRTANSLIDWISLLFPWSCYVFFLIKVNPVGIEWVLVWATNCLIPVCGDKIQGRRGNKVRIDNSIRHKTSISTPVSLQASLHPIYVLPKMDIGDKSPQLNILSYTLQFWFCEILCWRLFLRKSRSCLRCRWLPSWTGVYWKPSSAQVWNYSLYSFLGILCPFSNPLIFSLLIYSRTNWLGGKLYRRLSSLTLTRNIIKIKFFSNGLSEGRSPFYIYIISYCRFATTAIIILCVSCFCCVDRVYIFKEMSPLSHLPGVQLAKVQ